MTSVLRYERSIRKGESVVAMLVIVFGVWFASMAAGYYLTLSALITITLVVAALVACYGYTTRDRSDALTEPLCASLFLLVSMWAVAIAVRVPWSRIGMFFHQFFR